MNLATGETLVAACFCAFWLYTGFRINPLLGLILIIPAAFLVNWLVYAVLLLPLVSRAKNPGMLEVDSILATFGILFLVEGLMLVGFGGEYFSYTFLSEAFSIAGRTYGLNRVVAFIVAVVVTGLLYLFLNYTRYGTAIRAVAVDPKSAALSAINVERASAFAFALGGAGTAAAGALITIMAFPVQWLQITCKKPSLYLKTLKQEWCILMVLP
jgi:branched-chain amino acid transport system permease protein